MLNTGVWCLVFGIFYENIFFFLFFKQINIHQEVILWRYLLNGVKNIGLAGMSTDL